MRYNCTCCTWQLSSPTKALALEHFCSPLIMPAHRHAGLFTWWVLQKAPGRGQASRVLAVEPMPQNVAVMQANLQRCGLTNQVDHADCLPVSCCDTAGQHQWLLLHVNASCRTVSDWQLGHVLRLGCNVCNPARHGAARSCCTV